MTTILEEKRPKIPIINRFASAVRKLELAAFWALAGYEARAVVFEVTSDSPDEARTIVLGISAIATAVVGTGIYFWTGDKMQEINMRRKTIEE